MKNSKPATFRLVTQCLNQLRYRVSPYQRCNIFYSFFSIQSLRSTLSLQYTCCFYDKSNDGFSLQRHLLAHLRLLSYIHNLFSECVIQPRFYAELQYHNETETFSPFLRQNTTYFILVVFWTVFGGHRFIATEGGSFSLLVTRFYFSCSTEKLFSK